jgi:predicted Zn-dependent peptidase
MSEEFETFTLSNGLRVIYARMKGPASHCGIFIKAGSRNEQADETGLAHYLEHCMFKGTKKRKAYHVLNRLDAVGGEINAYTSKEETVIHASVLNEHLERSIELLSDITFESVFPEKEITKEKLIIIDEIHSYLDSPGEQIFDDFEELIYPNHPLGTNILGTAENLRSFKQQHLIAFRDRYYNPENMVLSVVGDITLNRVKKLAEKHLGHITRVGSPSEALPFEGYTSVHRTIEKDTYQAHLLLGGEAYSYHRDERRAMILLNNILGGPALNSRLNLNISEKYGFAYNLESSYVPYSDTGYFNIYLGTEAKYLDKSIQLIHRELKKLRETKLGSRQLHMAKKQLIGQIALAQESGTGQMMALGKSLLAFNQVDTLPVIYRDIEAITAEQLLEIANSVYRKENLSSLVFLPANK